MPLLNGFSGKNIKRRFAYEKERQKAYQRIACTSYGCNGHNSCGVCFCGRGVEGYWDIELFYKDTDTMVPSYVDETAEEKQVYVETMKEGEKLNLTYKLIDTEMPDNGYIKWYSDMPTLVDVDQKVWLRHLTHQRVR